MVDDTRPAETMVLATKSDTVDVELPKAISARSRLEPRGLLVGTAGTANFIDWRDQRHENVPLQAGYNPIRIKRLLTSGTVDDVWVLY